MATPKVKVSEFVAFWKFDRWGMFSAGLMLSVAMDKMVLGEWFGAFVALTLGGINVWLVYDIDKLDREIAELDRRVDELEFKAGE